MRGIVATFLVWLILGAGGAGAQVPGASEWSGTESGRLRLVSSVRAVGEASPLRLGLQFQLEPGWKIYWRSPGDAGYPPRLDWTGSVNAGEPVILWPAPHRFVLAGLQNHGYVGEVILPLDVRPDRPGQPVALRLAVDFLACSQICVPRRADLALDLPAGAAEPTARAHDIGRFAALVPGDGARHGLAVTAAEAVGEGDAQVLRLTIAASQPLDQPDLFVEADEVAGFGQPRLRLAADRRGAVLEAPVNAGTVLRPLAGSPVRVTVVDGSRAMEAEVTPVPGVASATAEPARPGAAGLLSMMAVALLGGLILNLMPCVLPVLSIKLLGILGHGGGERGHARSSFLASAAGIVASFLVLALAAIAARQAGQAVGWGIQFQQPAFLSAMIALLALFAANLWGVFEIPMPGWLVNRVGGVSHHTVLGHFLSGAFATLLATPCSAPFLGTAVGFALARGPGEIMAIFVALGLGMAAPFLAVAVWPDAALRLPRPGRWMVGVRRLMGVALAATGVWLASVLAVQAGMMAALVSVGAMAAALAVLAVRPRLPAGSRSAVWIVVVALAGLAVAAPVRQDADSRADQGAGPVTWIAFDPEAIGRLVAAGQVVFVDVTADWCITCKVNKAAVVERGEVARRLGGPAVVAMKADWTRPDERIGRFLASFGRYGIPFNVVYGPAAPDGVALPELLTEAEVMAALDRAAGVAH